MHPKASVVKIMCSLFVLISLAAVSMAQPAPGPANPAANAQTKAVLLFFQSLEGQPDKRLVSGQFSNFGRGANLDLMNRVHEKTGHWPALLGVDYADFGRGGLTTAAPNKAAIEYWRQGGLVSVSAH